MAENIGDAFILVEYVLRNVVQQEASGRPLSNEALGFETVGCYYVSILSCSALCSSQAYLSEI